MVPGYLSGKGEEEGEDQEWSLVICREKARKREKIRNGSWLSVGKRMSRGRGRRSGKAPGCLLQKAVM
jgi:hypothetical protein